MPEKKESEQEKPTFDLDNLSWEHETEYAFARNRISMLNFTAEDNERWVQVLVKVLNLSLVSVPRHLLLKDAPEDIDWSKPESMKFLKWGSFNKLHDAFGAYRDEIQKK